MATVSIHWADDTLKRYADLIARVDRESPVILPRIVNQVGNRAKTVVIRNLTKQTGLPRKTIVKAVGDPSRATAGKLSYTMVTRGGFVRVKYLGAREVRGGVRAKPFGKSTFFAGAFMKGGSFPRRVNVPAFDGHAYRRLNASGTKITQVRSQVRIPHEMTTGATVRAFEQVAGPLLEQRVMRMLGQYFAK
ncbi:hypothetical protein XM25_19870 [Devosia sp. H5989]|nr:hypothetical protein XM25_19870 [Devosia sp. H5989]